MLELEINGQEYFNEITNKFFKIEPTVLQLEHSLYSLAKWESKWKKPFISKKEKMYDELIDYIKCMTINKVDPKVYSVLTDNHFEKIYKYMDDSMTATTIKDNGKKNHDVITAEIIYWEMFELHIPLECEHWHLNRLLMQIQVCAIKNQPPKKMKRSAIINQQRALNEARKLSMGTNG